MNGEVDLAGRGLGEPRGHIARASSRYARVGSLRIGEPISSAHSRMVNARSEATL
jgi:hypothetical protein